MSKYFPPLYLSLIIPLYNEEERIKKSIERIVPYLEKTIKDYEIILVDDGSIDNTLAVVTKLKNDRFHLIRNDQNRGKGYAIQKGVLKAKFPLVLFSDADSSTPIEEMEKFFPFLENYDIIIGSRALKDSRISVHQPFYKEWAGRFGNKLIQAFLLPGLKDTQCGFKLFKKESLVIFQKQTIKRWGFDFGILWLAKKMGFRVKEVPVQWQNDFRSKFKILDYFRTTKELLKIGWNILTNKYKL